jgi:hypothetical protein
MPLMKRLSMLGRVLRALTIRIAYYVIALAISITAFAYADITPGTADLEGHTYTLEYIAAGPNSNAAPIFALGFEAAKADAKAKSTAALKIAIAVSLAAFAGAFILGERRTTVHHRHRRQG